MSARQTEVLGSPVGRTASMTPSALQGVSPFFPEGAGGVERRPSGPLQPGQAQPQIVMCHFGDPGQPFQLHRLDDATPASAIRPGGPPMPSPLRRGASVPMGAAPVMMQVPEGAAPAPGVLYRAQTARARQVVLAVVVVVVVVVGGGGVRVVEPSAISFWFHVG
ncbi:unnamed protein product, partial [Prorocentrum cordatum]